LKIQQEKLMKIIIGFILGLAIGAGCRWYDVPVPSPPKLMGALLVVAMTVGYMGADTLIAKTLERRGEAPTTQVCGGPHPQTKAELAQNQRSACHSQ
jgi:XapX domain-containing protein